MIYATVAMSVLVIVFAEVLPKTMAINKPDQAALLLARPVSWAVALFGPLTMAIEAFVRAVLRLCGIDISSNQSVLSPARRFAARSTCCIGRAGSSPRRARCSAACSTSRTSRSPT